MYIYIIYIYIALVGVLFKKGALKNFAKCTGNTCVGVSF